MKAAWIRLALLLAMQVGALITMTSLEQLDTEELKQVCHQLHHELKVTY